ncbi:unnamed protein product [Dracunculus medinensis]|uniref:Lipase n=1 Tax=Dracunculus medinensis TaxID=318479 RepID=A0A0N4UQ73_DRAME|nr:unnamed protein product [Dracunculus medinensis]
MTTPEIIAYYGYPVEIYSVTTEDGYILELHRIPYGKNGTTNDFHANKSVIFLQHGFIGSSAVWVTNLPDQSAGFLFADAGYDIWMGNARGNTYSANHTLYTKKDREFWEFTWNEISEIDLSTMIDFVLNKTNLKSLYYVGYSEGTLTMFVKLVTDQSFAKKIKKFFALGPIGTLTNIKGLIKIAAENFMRPLRILVSIGGEFMPNTSLFSRMSKAFCSIHSITAHCQDVMFQITGPDTSQMNQTRIPVYMTHLPAGTSIANLHHWAQMVNSHKVQMYDLGSRRKNQRRYGSDFPPVHNLSFVNVPVYLYWSDTDWLADKQDIQEGLLDVIPEEYLMENNEIQNFNHFDFIWGIHAVKEIYQPILRIIDNDQKKSL